MNYLRLLVIFLLWNLFLMTTTLLAFPLHQATIRRHILSETIGISFATRKTTKRFPRLFMSTESGSLRTLASGSHMAEMEVKKSRLIGYAKHVESWDDAQSYLHDIQRQHPKARHWCFGFRCGTNPVTERCSDDGEPTGTAGQPILGAIHGEDLSDTMCVVVRYFGGIKLGAGGLIRAYGAAARLVLRDAPISILIPKSTVTVKVDAVHIGAVYDIASKLNAVGSGEEYGTDGSLTVTLTCETSTLEDLRSRLIDSTRGEAKFVNHSTA